MPFTGRAHGAQAVASGQVDARVLPVVGGAESPARDGRARIVAVAAPERLHLAPNAPTLAELGIPLSTGVWLALHAPARTPQPVVARLNQAVRDAARNQQLLAASRQQAAIPEPSTAGGLAASRKRERERRAAVVQGANIIVG